MPVVLLTPRTIVVWLPGAGVPGQRLARPVHSGRTPALPNVVNLDDGNAVAGLATQDRGVTSWRNNSYYRRFTVVTRRNASGFDCSPIGRVSPVVVRLQGVPV